MADLYRTYWSTPETEPMTAFVSLHREIDILERQVGAEAAWRTLEAAARAWYEEHRACPFCKHPDVLHLEAFEKEYRPVADGQEGGESERSTPNPYRDTPMEADAMDDEPIRVMLRRIEKKLDTLLRVIGKTKPGRPSPMRKG